MSKARRRELVAIGCVVVAMVVAVTLTVRFVIGPAIAYVLGARSGEAYRVLIYAACTVVMVVYIQGIDAILRAVHGDSAETFWEWAKRLGG